MENNNKVQITKDELESIIALRNQILENVESVGRVNIRKHILSAEIDSINDELKNIFAKSVELDFLEKEKITEIVSKYGEGSLDFETGEYTLGNSSEVLKHN